MSANLSSADAILKDDYMGPLRSNINGETLLLSKIDMNDKDIAGRQAVIPVRFNNNQATGARAESAVLPVAGQATYKELKTDLKNYYGVMRCSGPVMRQTQKGEKGSFLRIVDAESKSISEQLKLNLGHDIYLGHTLAVAAVNVATNVIVLDALTNMNYFDVGMFVDIVDAATGLTFAAQNRQITAVDPVAPSITVSGAVVTTAVTDIVVRTQTYGVCLTSLDEIVDSTGTLFGVDPNVYTRWKSTEKTTAAMTLAEIQNFIDDIVVASGKYPSLIVGDFVQQRRYLALLQANRQYISSDPMPKQLAGGFKSLAYISGGQELEWLADRLSPKQQLLVLNQKELQAFSSADFEFIELDGKVWLPEYFGDSATDSFKATMFRDIELGAYSRNTHGKWTGITS